MSQKTLYEAFQHQVQSRPDATALLLDADAKVACRCSWHELYVMVNRAADRIEHQLNRNPTLPRRVTHLNDNRDADIVIEGSRPRAFEALGIDRRSIRLLQTSAQHHKQLWLSLTAYGRFGAAAEWVGFGDDVAASAGVLDHSSDGDYGFVGDAIADPLAGLQAAVTIKECLRQNLRGLLDFSLFRAARIALETVERLYDSPLAPLKKARTRC